MILARLTYQSINEVMVSFVHRVDVEHHNSKDPYICRC